MSSAVEAHADLIAVFVLGALVLLVALSALRPEVWVRLFFERVDPRPLGLMRIGFGLVVLWTFLDLLPSVRVFFTDEGMWLTGMARARWGGPLRYLWDPVHGFEHWWSPLRAALGAPSVLHLRSDPPFVFTLYGLLLVSLMLMVLGIWTRWTTIVSWILADQLYRYNGIFYTGGDFVIRAFFFLGMLSRWGEAYSIDAWRRQRRLILAGATEFPALRQIPAWPQRLMMLELACIYCATGLLKSGPTWRDGTALYYALNLDHFYRVPAQGLVAWMQHFGVLPLLTWVTRWWEVLFPLALVGAALRGYEAERAAGTWPAVPKWRRQLSHVLLGALWLVAAGVAGVSAYHHYVPPDLLPWVLNREQVQIAVTLAVAAAPLPIVAIYRWLRRRFPRGLRLLLHWVLGKRVWLVFGFLVHSGIDLGMNVGTFSQAIVAPYLCWLSGREVDAFWRYLLSRPLRAGEGSRPRRTGLARVMLGFFDRLVYRAPGRVYAIHYHPNEAGVRRAALLRPWDLGHRVRFVADERLAPERLRLDIEGHRPGLEGTQAAAALIRVFPGLWWLGLPASMPVVRRWTGPMALRILGQA